MRRLPLLLLGFVAACGGYHLPKTDGVDGAAQLENEHLRPSVCSGIDLHPDYGMLDEKALISFLKGRGFPIRIERARNDLVYVELQLNPERDEWVRLRVAILPSSAEAGRELHEAVLQHGEGAWGVHRANLAVLAPIGRKDDILAFVERTKLACWGVLTVAGANDTEVIPGGYREL